MARIADWLNRIETLREPTDAGRAEATDAAFGELLARVSQVTGLELSQYKEATLRRQTARRYRVLGFDSLDAYLAHARDDAEELLQLQRQFLISVSSFFRDPEVFDALEKALRHLIKGKREGDSIRVWVPACATGEEAYSVAMLLGEILGERLEPVRGADLCHRYRSAGTRGRALGHLCGARHGAVESGAAQTLVQPEGKQLVAS